jgi:hypothetical protein
VTIKQGFAPGDRVEWTSQSAGSTRTKFGFVEAVVAAGERPAAMSKNRNPGGARDHVSYLVRVRGKNGGLYWPRAAALRAFAGEGAAKGETKEKSNG